MEEFIQKLKSLFTQHFSASDLEVEPAGNNRVGGFLIWEGFSGLEQIERQRKVWKFLRQELRPEEQFMISAILTLTPEEMASARAG